MSIDVIYLARGTDWGIKTVRKFFDSYKKYPAGTEHNLIIAAKAWDTCPEDYKELQQLANDYNAKIIDLPDDGYDFGAYYRVAQKSNADYILCLVSTSEIMDNNWLLKYKNAFDKNEKLKYIGTTGSWGITPIAIDIFREELREKYQRPSFKYHLKKVWKYLNNYSIVYKTVHSPLTFPNYHVRTNAFMIDRKLYLSFMLKYKIPKNKIETYHLESGYNSLTRFVLKHNFEVGVIGKDEKIYSKEEWDKSKTFFSPDMSNLLIKDRYYEFYNNLSNRDKTLHEFYAWGSFLTKKFDGRIKFSVLLPTKNRLDLLKYAINSVINQTYNNWEIIVADNFSDEDIEGHVKSLNDDRIKYTRSPEPLPVTNNWNVANNLATGDYIIMLGDDDALLPDFFEKCLEVIEKNSNPHVLTFGAYIYMQPNVAPSCPKGKIEQISKISPLFLNKTEPFIMESEFRKNLVKESLKFNYQFGFNMQYFLYSREFYLKLRKLGDFYEPPYPDYYTANMIMLLADTVVAIPEDLVVIGVTPKSYGYYYQNNNEKEGMKFHNDDNYRRYAPKNVRKKLCNVAEMQTAALATFALIPARLPDKGLNIDLNDYYKAVINRIVTDYDKINAWTIVIREVFPKISLHQYWPFFKFTQRAIRQKIEPIITNDSTSSYENVELLIEDIKNKKVFVNS